MSKKRRPRSSLPSNHKKAGPHGYFGPNLKPAKPSLCVNTPISTQMLCLPQLPLSPAPRESPVRIFRIMLYHDSLQNFEYFQKMLARHVMYYIHTTDRPLDEVRVELRHVPPTKLEEILRSEGITQKCEESETFLQCQLLEFCKTDPADLVVAVGAASQKILTALAQKAKIYTYCGTRFLTLAEALKRSPIPLQPDSEEAQAFYFHTMAERIYAEQTSV